MRARGFRPCCFSARSETISSAAAASEIWLDTAAVMRPPSRSVFSVAIFSSEVSRRGPSSARDAVARRRSRARSVPRRWRGWRGGDSSSANCSMSSRRDAPLLGDHVGGAELRHLLGAVALLPARRAGEGIRKAERLRQRSSPRRSGSGSCSARRRRRSRRWCRSSPPAPRSARPAATSRTADRWWCPARRRAARRPASRCGRCRRPAGRWCRRSRRRRPRPRAGSMPVRSMSALIACAPRSAGCTLLSPPPRRPTGVRTASMM